MHFRFSVHVCVWKVCILMNGGLETDADFLAGVSFSSQVLCQLGSFCLCSLSTMIRYLGTTHATPQVQENVPGRQTFRMAPSLIKVAFSINGWQKRSEV